MNEIFDRTGWLRSDIVFPLGLVIAAVVTVHVLLTKRDVASAVGWIGLAWLSPLMGGFLYFVLGINRVQRRARRLRVRPRQRGGRRAAPSPLADNRLRQLERGVGRLTERMAEPGNALEIFHDGDQAYPPMLAAIAAAEHSIGLSTYIMRADEAGNRFIDALAAAHNRGVSVRVLVDGVGSGWVLSRAYWRLRREGVPAARFMHSPLPWRMPFLNLRTHKKILVVDGRTGFTGGMNIASENVMALKPPAPVQDTHFRVRGPVVAQLTDAFTQDWAFATDEDLEGEAWFPPIEAAGGTTARVITSGPDQDIEKIEFVVLQAIACARESVSLMTPYFLPDERLITALSLAAIRGVAVDIVIPAKSDHRLLDWATRPNIEPILADGCRVWLGPPPFRHSKTMVVDGEWCLIGSSNWDMRSLRLNFELCMEVYDQTLAAALTALMVRNRGVALTRRDIAARRLPVRLRDAGVRLLLPYL
ncbi:MAG: cardiolipin synthase [Acetobacteraceae bacterium]